nr:tyrosine-type recombinase/integrase [Marinilabilia salmonicolor]
MALTPSEIKKLEEVKLSPLLDKIRDLWLFQMYTCQRISDVKSYSPEQIQDSAIGPIWEFTAQKTGKLTTVPLYGKAARAYEILQKYDFKLPIVVEQYLNREIKKVAKIAGLTRKKHLTRHKGNKRVNTAKEVHELISSHSARRTGITRLLGEGIPLNIVQMISQHSDIKTLMKYSEPEKETLLSAFG